MRYMLLIGGEAESTESNSKELCSAEDGRAWVEEMERRGVLLSGDILRPASDATTVRVRGDQVLLSDGPFAETKEQMGGYCVIECADLDEAIEIAAKHPVATFGMVEIRPLFGQ